MVLKIEMKTRERGEEIWVRKDRLIEEKRWWRSEMCAIFFLKRLRRHQRLLFLNYSTQSHFFSLSAHPPFLLLLSCLWPGFTLCWFSYLTVVFSNILLQHFSAYFCSQLLNVCVFHPRERCSGSDALVTCSALKRHYRWIMLHGAKALDQDILPPIAPDVFFLFLQGDYSLIHQRVASRRGHYMKADLLHSQFDILEPPLEEDNVLTLDISRSITDVAIEVEKHIIKFKPSPPMP